MANHGHHRGGNKRQTFYLAVGACVIAVAALCIILPVIKRNNNRYAVGRKTETPQQDIDVEEYSEGKAEVVAKFDSDVADDAFIRKEDASLYAKIITLNAHKALGRFGSELNDYYMLTSWLVPYTNMIRIPDLINMTVDEIAPIKVVVYHDDDLYLIDLGNIADLDTFEPATGALKFHFPYPVMAYALFEPKRDI